MADSCVGSRDGTPGAATSLRLSWAVEFARNCCGIPAVLPNDSTVCKYGSVSVDGFQMVARISPVSLLFVVALASSLAMARAQETTQPSAKPQTSVDNQQVYNQDNYQRHVSHMRTSCSPKVLRSKKHQVSWQLGSVGCGTGCDACMNVHATSR